MTTVLGHRGYLGAIVERRWREMGWDGDYVIDCTGTDDLRFLRRLAARPGVIVPSTDAIAEDTDYAARKRAVEAITGLVVIRAGIVDFRKPNTYANWYCNPLTPLEWADLAWELRDKPGVHLAGRETVTRGEIGGLWGGTWPTFAERELWRVQPQDRERPLIADAIREYRPWHR